jgi:opacity protein-like surface antigen
MKMKKVSLLALALSSVATAAFAQVAPAPAPMVAAAPPCPCPKAFQGFHLGGNIGYGVGYGKTIVNGTQFALSHNNKLGVSGFDGGLNVGYTHRFGNIGVGLEGVFNWASVKGSARQAGNFTYTAKLQNSIQLRGNLSYIICNLVAPKIILGWDNSKWERKGTILNGDGSVFANGNRGKGRYNSFLWGAGVDFLVAKHVIAGLEYTGTTAGRKTQNITNIDGTAATYSFKPQYNKFALTVKVIY